MFCVWEQTMIILWKWCEKYSWKYLTNTFVLFWGSGFRELELNFWLLDSNHVMSWKRSWQNEYIYVIS